MVNLVLFVAITFTVAMWVGFIITNTLCFDHPYSSVLSTGPLTVRFIFEVLAFVGIVISVAVFSYKILLT